MRIKLKDCDKYIFSTEIKVRVTDFNYGNHVGNEMMLLYAQQARTEFIKSLGYTELNMEGMGIIVTDAAVIYKAEVNTQTTLRIDIAIEDLTPFGFDYYYKVTNTETNVEVASIKTGILCFNYNTRKIGPIPEVVEEKLLALIE